MRQNTYVNSDGDRSYFPFDSAEKEKMLKKLRKFHVAINTLASVYGTEVRHAILDRKVKLTECEVIILAKVARCFPQEYDYLGQIICAGNTRLLKDLIRVEIRPIVKAHSLTLTPMGGGVS